MNEKWSLQWGLDHSNLPNSQDNILPSTDVKNLEEDIFTYAKKNLAVVNVYIKDPVVTRIMRDQKSPIIAFVANTGGLLGLCMGFSLVSLFEIFYHLLGIDYRCT